MWINIYILKDSYLGGGSVVICLKLVGPGDLLLPSFHHAAQGDGVRDSGDRAQTTHS